MQFRLVFCKKQYTLTYRIFTFFTNYFVKVSCFYKIFTPVLHTALHKNYKAQESPVHAPPARGWTNSLLTTALVLPNLDRLLVTKTKNTWTARQAHLAWEFKALVPKQIAAFC